MSNEDEVRALLSSVSDESSLSDSSDTWNILLSDSEGTDMEDGSDAPDVNCEPSTSADPSSKNASVGSQNLTWKPVAQVTNQFPFVGGNQVGINPNVASKLQGATPYDVYKHFIDKEVIDLLVTETNTYAQQTLTKSASNRGRGSRLNQWIDCNSCEMKTFLGIIMWMGLVKMPKIADYWSKCILYQNEVSKCMSRNRFELLLRMFHCADNESAPEGNRLYKITPLLDLLLVKFHDAYIPGEELCVDETNIPFRGRLSFRQYIPNKRHKYGIKAFKLCVKSGYTWSLKVYAGQEASQECSVSEKVVMELLQPLLDIGRTLYCDNWYSSVSLAHSLNARSTHLVGTLRKNRKGNPPEVVNAKLQKGQVAAKMSNTNVMILKWKDKRDVLMISTKHDDSLVTVTRRRGEIRKPAVVVDYNKGKSFIDISDQMASYSTSLRRTVKWYRKLMIEFITSTSLVNALALYNEINNTNMQVTTFKEQVAVQLLRNSTKSAGICDKSPPGSSVQGLDGRREIQQNISKHVLMEAHGEKSKVRRKCTLCYEKQVKSHGRKYAQSHGKKVCTKCSVCTKYYCLSCFNETHYKK